MIKNWCIHNWLKMMLQNATAANGRLLTIMLNTFDDFNFDICHSLCDLLINTAVILQRRQSSTQQDLSFLCQKHVKNTPVILSADVSIFGQENTGGCQESIKKAWKN
ncbi:MAG: hypothetical protein WCP19_08095 [Chloroflexota bacterium]